jgi:hypothetical protein
MSTLTTTTILTGTTISIRTISTEITSIAARDKVIGSITRNTVATRLTVTGEQQTSSAPTIGSSQALVARELAPEQEIGPGLVLALAIDQAAVLALAIAQAVERGLETVLVAVQALATGRAVERGLVIVLVAVQGLAIGQAVVLPPSPAEGLELVPVVEALVLARAAVTGLPHDRLAVLPGTKSVTVAHHHGLAPVPAAEDLVAVVEVTREPAAAEVDVVWVVAG